MKSNRRNFLQRNCAAIGTASLYSTLCTMRMTAGATTNTTGYKALVCLFLNGGNDSFNMLIPYTGANNAAGYGGYRDARGGVGTDSSGFKNGGSGLAIDRSALLATRLNSVSNQPVSRYSVHPRLPFLAQQFNNGNLAFVANVGSLIQPTTLSSYQQGNAELPLGLFSHPDHQMHWQTLMPQVRGATPKGWGGRIADIFHQAANPSGQVAMNISLAGNNTLQTGFGSTPYVTSPDGPSLLLDYNNNLIKNAVDSILANTYPNMFEHTYANKKQEAVANAVTFGNAFDNASLSNPVPNTTISNNNKTAQQLAGVIRSIKAGKDSLNMNRQMFFVERGGWDHHNELLDAQGGISYANNPALADGSNGLFYEINEALEYFWSELTLAGLQDEVILFTVSDFGRTLTSNGQGSDHAWGGNAFVMGGGRDSNGTTGGPLKGGQIYGQYPILDPNNITLDLDVHLNRARGRILPTTSADEYLSELVSWFGVDTAQLPDIFPNCTNFFNPASTGYPLGMLD